MLAAISLSLLASGLYAQTSPLAITLRAVHSENNNEKKIEATLTSTQIVHFPCSGVSMLKVSVYGPDGTVARDTAKGAARKTAQSTSPSHSTICISDTMEPGQSVKESIDVGELYEMNIPGTYIVQLKFDIPGGPPISSNKLSVVVK
ncbi:hypothetical protein [Silvibacterium bohemicum]|nr:hypothetical protein [Silvibacterium bohemicum]